MDPTTTHIVRPQGLGIMANTLIPSAFSTPTFWKTSTTTLTITHNITKTIPSTAKATLTKTIIRTATKTITSRTAIPTAVYNRLFEAAQIPDQQIPRSAIHWAISTIILSSGVGIAGYLYGHYIATNEASARAPPTVNLHTQQGNSTSWKSMILAKLGIAIAQDDTLRQEVETSRAAATTAEEAAQKPSTKRQRSPKKRPPPPSQNTPAKHTIPTPSKWATPKNRIDARAAAYHDAIQANTPRLIRGEDSLALGDEEKVIVEKKIREWDARASLGAKKRKAEDAVDEEGPKDHGTTRASAASSLMGGLRRVWRAVPAVWNRGEGVGRGKRRVSPHPASPCDDEDDDDDNDEDDDDDDDQSVSGMPVAIILDTFPSPELPDPASQRLDFERIPQLDPVGWRRVKDIADLHPDTPVLSVEGGHRGAGWLRRSPRSPRRSARRNLNVEALSRGSARRK